MRLEEPTTDTFLVMVNVRLKQDGPYASTGSVLVDNEDSIEIGDGGELRLRKADRQLTVIAAGEWISFTTLPWKVDS